MGLFSLKKVSWRRRFDGETYTNAGVFDTKSEAKAYARRTRREAGKKARVVKLSKGYAVYRK